MTEKEKDKENEDQDVGEETNIEIRSLRSCMHALGKVKTPAARKRVLDWVTAKINEELLKSLPSGEQSQGLHLHG